MVRTICRPSVLFVISMVCLLSIGGLPLGSTQAAEQPDEPVVARISTSSQEDVEQLARLGLDLLAVREGDDVFALTTPEEMERLRQNGWQVVVDESQTALLHRVSSNTFAGGYRTVPEMRAVLERAAVRHPNLAEFFIYGRSWEKLRSRGASGSDLFGIKLTNRQRPGPKPTLFVMAALHPREIATPEIALRLVDYLLSYYNVDGDVTWLLDEQQIVVVPVANPDGHRWAAQGYYQRKNTNTSYGGTCAYPPQPTNQYGVDLNRNFDFQWGRITGPSYPKCGSLYPGPSAASEPETVALQNLIRSLFPDQRGPGLYDAAPLNATGMLVTLHSYGNLVFWPWGWTGSRAPNAADLAMIGRRMAAYAGYSALQGYYMYPMSGSTDDWVYGERGIASFTFEIGPNTGLCGGFMPPFSCLDSGDGGRFWPRTLAALLYAARLARTPYLLGRGPVTEELMVTVRGNQADLSAVADDRGNGGQDIITAEYYINVPPWRGGKGTRMAAIDGAFDSPRERVVATTGPWYGRHLVYVRGRDNQGNWGLMRARRVQFAPAPWSVWLPLVSR